MPPEANKQGRICSSDDGRCKTEKAGDRYTDLRILPHKTAEKLEMAEKEEHTLTRDERIGANVQALMRAKRMKVGMLGIIIEKTPQTVTKRLQHPETFTVSELIKIAEFFNVPLSEVVA